MSANGAKPVAEVLTFEEDTVVGVRVAGAWLKLERKPHAVTRDRDDDGWLSFALADGRMAFAREADVQVVVCDFREPEPPAEPRDPGKRSR